MEKENFIALTEKYSKGQCTAEEEKAVVYFLEHMQQREVEILFQEKQKTRLLKAVRKKTNQPQKQVKKALNPILKIAASIIIILGLAMTYQLFFQQKTLTEIAQKGERKEILLPDNTKVFLNANSRLSYPEEFEDTREVFLQGEAFFEVKRNPKKPFIVKTKSTQTQVLGTSFNINAYHKNCNRVSVLHGKVNVQDINKKHHAVMLTKNQQVVYNGKNPPKLAQENSHDDIAWIKNTIILKNNTLKSTAQILENWYDISITFESKALEKLRISGKFKDEKLENVLRSIAYLKHIKIDSITKNELIIRKNTAID